MLAYAIYTCAFSTDQPLTTQPLQPNPLYCNYGSSWIEYKWNGYDDGYLTQERNRLCTSVCEKRECQREVVDIYTDYHNDNLLALFLDDHPIHTPASDLCPEFCYPECFPQLPDYRHSLLAVTSECSFVGPVAFTK
jgi:hypothetical protein